MRVAGAALKGMMAIIVKAPLRTFKIWFEA